MRAILLLTILSSIQAQTVSHGTVERVKVYARSLEGALAGDSADRDVSVYLPPSYKSNSSKRFPVVYFLHGFTDSDAQWFGIQKHWIHLPTVLDQTFSKAGVREMIVVMPNAFTRFFGSMYSNSVTVGDWETFVSKDLVSYIDSHYRTLADRNSRGLAGHSMGGYGTIRIGMKRPDVFASIYALSPCCLQPNFNGEMFAKAEVVTSVDEIAKADFLTKALLASGAAWSANPNKPPLFLDLPFEKGSARPEIQARWQANAPLITLHQQVPQLRELNAIAVDVGTKDTMIASTVVKLDAALRDYKIPHTYETYDGDHINGIAERIETKVIPFFSTHFR